MRATAACLVLALSALATDAAAQDTLALQGDTVMAPGQLETDSSRVRPFHRVYEMFVHHADSAVLIGHRSVALAPATYAGSPAWLLIEKRSGIVPAVESLYVAPNLRPLHWSSVLGKARLAAEFVGDTIYGATTTPSGRQNIILASRPDLIVSTALAELLIPLLPLTFAWTDSVGTLAIDAVSSALVPAELTVIGEEEFAVDSLTRRPAWIVLLRAAPQNVIYWIDKENGAALRIEQPLPVHAGRLLEIRLRAEAPLFPLLIPWRSLLSPE